MRKKIIDIAVDVISQEEAVSKVVGWSLSNERRYVCAANVHMCMEAHDDSAYQRVLEEADLVVADGMPLVWVQKLLGARGAVRVRGPDLMLALCESAERNGVRVGMLGSTPEVLKALQVALERSFPRLKMAYIYSPPFRPMTDGELEDALRGANQAGVQILFVGMGCPKQEFWMWQNKQRLDCVQVGVGAAFDFISGNKKTAPTWVQDSGFEWLYRLLSEPRRLWKRYLKHNPRYIALAFVQVVRYWLKRFRQ